MLDPHSGSEYGAARIAAMIAAAVTIVLTVLAAFGSMVPYAQADSFGALTINAVWGRDTASPKLLAGDTYSIVRVATVTTNNDGSVSSYKTVGDFSGLTADWERLTSSEYHDAAKKLATHAAKNKLYQHSGTTNVAGQLTFQNLPLGLYLVSRTSSAKANKAYDCDPFLISIPGSGDTSADLNITVEPKFSTGTPVSRPKITRARAGQSWPYRSYGCRRRQHCRGSGAHVTCYVHFDQIAHETPHTGCQFGRQIPYR